MKKGAWALPYGALMTLLVAMMMALYAGASQDRDRLKQIAVSLRKALGEVTPGQVGAPDEGVPPPSMGAAPPGASPVATNPVCAPASGAGASITVDSKTRELMDAIEENARVAMGEELSKKVEMEPMGDGEIRLRVAAQDFYRVGMQEIAPHYRVFMDRVAGILASAERDVRIVGHADPQEVRAKAAFTSTWDLSQARAALVAKQWIERGGMTPAKITVAGRAHYEPLDPEKYPWVQKSGNRRIEIWIR